MEVAPPAPIEGGRFRCEYAHISSGRVEDHPLPLLLANDLHLGKVALQKGF